MEILSVVSPDDFPFDWYAIANEKHFWFKSRMDAFMRFAPRYLSLNENLHVMEIGCGNGLVRKQLENTVGWTVDGCDINEAALKLNEGLKGKTFLYNIHERNERFRDLYDAIILFDVLEHIPDSKAFLESILFHLKPRGILFINVPALNQYKSDYDEVVGHVRRYNKKMMDEAFKSLPAKVLGHRYWAMALLPALIARKKLVRNKGDIKAVVEKGLQPPNALLNSLFYSLLKTEKWLFSNPPIGASLMTAIQKDRYE
ncbi:MAG: methyltransferase domain-containing protein [Bacteroidetes bacterium]|nr:methyltransferase domain-containing protein [Bacteroidota bacterium]